MWCILREKINLLPYATELTCPLEIFLRINEMISFRILDMAMIERLTLYCSATGSWGAHVENASINPSALINIWPPRQPKIVN